MKYIEQWTEDIGLQITYTEHLCSKRSKYQEIDFYKSDTLGTFFTLDGLMMVTEKDEFIYHEMITHIAMAVNCKIKNVLIIGGGDCGTSREVLKYENVINVDMVEIDEMVVDLCKEYLPITSSHIDTEDRLSIYYEDGLEFVKNANEKTYDLILVDSTDPISIGEGLFTNEFYDNCYRILTNDGILINQHESPYFTSYANEMKRAHNKIKTKFKYSYVYQFHMPTYPSGHWLFGFSSKAMHPYKNIDFSTWENNKIKTKYYNKDIHVGSFMLPTYVKEMLDE